MSSWSCRCVSALGVLTSRLRGRARSKALIITVMSLMLRGLEPASGSALGGTTVTLFGLGFCADPVVQFDGVFQEILETSAQQIMLRTRPHRGGRAHVRVRCDDRIVNRHRGYLFEAELGFVGISPVRGAIAGGTEVYVVGQGFARGAFGHSRRSGDAGGARALR